MRHLFSQNSCLGKASQRKETGIERERERNSAISCFIAISLLQVCLPIVVILCMFIRKVIDRERVSEREIIQSAVL